MKITSPLPERKARIEIIPLIDIMFFLLAAFMLASLALIHLKTIGVNLPSAQTGAPEFETAAISIDVDQRGDLFVDHKRVTAVELGALLAARVQKNTNTPVYISGDRRATHGDVIRVLDIARAAGAQRVSFAVAAEAAAQ